MTLYDYARSRLFEITQLSSSNLKMLLTNQINYSKLLFDKAGYVIVLAKPQQKGRYYALHGFKFPESAQCSIIQMFTASLYHIGIHVLSSDFRIYREWSKNKEITTANYAKSIVEDTVVDAYLKIYWPSLRPVFSYANAISYTMLKPVTQMTSSGQSLSQVILSLRLTGKIKGNPTNDIIQKANKIMKILTKLDDNILEKSKIIMDDKSQNTRIEPSATKKERIDTVSAIWEILSDIDYYSTVSDLPYGEYWGETSAFYNNINLTYDHSEIIKSTYNVLNMNYVQEEYIKHQARFANESIQVFDDQETYDDRVYKKVQQYAELGKDLRFKSYNMPNEDYSEFWRKRNLMAGQIRRIQDEVRKIKQVTDENPMEECGAVDLQTAIQVLSSNSPRRDIFIKEDVLQKSESWAILLDSSLSLRMQNTDVKSIAICLAEVAKEMLPRQDSWGLFSFNDTYQIIKDFYEPYSNRSRSKIGGLQHRGLSFLPDAIELTAKALVKTSEDVKLLLIITDGIPVGYNEIYEKFINSIEMAQKANLNPIIIGIGNELKELKNACFSVDNTFDMMKKFVKVYQEVQSLN